MIQAFACTSETLAGFQSTFPKTLGRSLVNGFLPADALDASRSDGMKKPQAMARGNSTVCHKTTPRFCPSRTQRLNHFDPYRCNSSRVSLPPTMSTAAEYLLADIARLGNSTISDKTLPALKALNARALDFADSLMPKGSSIDDLSDFNDALNELTGVIDNLDEPTASAGSQPAGRPYPNESLAYNF